MNFEECLDDAVKFGDTQRTCFTKGYEAGQQSQQGEVDKLQTKVDELQVRIDDAIALLEYNEYVDSPTSIGSLKRRN